ncbi:malate:quinone oxidoreductase [Taibaiella helva]|uniref:malate:quinone oxidoreductase n=1 Tax=Taibaiella helva TaxID=2301235 RepID=UPI000E569B66|nr:malate:quinone oxidoreductase [Taibaiella helva]
MSRKQEEQTVDVVLIGAGIMSATLGVFLKQLQPDWTIEVLERLDEVAAESSAAWNNAGTGHSALCELNYTPEKEDGTVDCTKAYKINEQFETSKQFWAYLVEQGHIKGDFIQPVPHMSFVRGEQDMAFLKKRVATLTQNALFDGMQYSEDHETLKTWVPLMMAHRDPEEKVAATRMDIGTDVNFGALTWSMIRYLFRQPGVGIHVAHEVKDVERSEDGQFWEIKVRNMTTDQTRKIRSRFVFIGAGGGALHLLEKSDIPEAKGYGGFPVSGQWLRCINPDIIEKHHAKVYGKAAVGAPPMSVPHLDSRMINGKKELLFGPFAGFSTKFLKNGSYMDLPSSIKFNNIVPMIQVGLHNMQLTKYLIQQVRLSPEEKLEALKEFYPDAKLEDWELAIAGQRVQVIKKDKNGDGILEFGTELVHAADGSIAALLGASPGASTSVSVMLDLLKACFGEEMKTAAWQEKLKEMIPTYGQHLSGNPALIEKTRSWTSAVLRLDPGVAEPV